MATDVTEITAFAAELMKVPAKIAKVVAPVLTAAGAEIASQARELISHQLEHPTRLPWYTKAITSQVVKLPAGLTVMEAGPEQSISGLGVGIELGSRNTHPLPHLFPAFAAVWPTTLAELDAVVFVALAYP